ncbi:MAG: hypothetical protein ABH824_02575 [Nanoarchaeota archaeon]|nr:hypothetical protein [Nanoarchaeota archaeon]MBU1632133.1 hypothetical protein [Nanoarchaeota archaeon]MBU1876198.1 hypothetical protein [Nanoarchaeota archaeon]
MAKKKAVKHSVKRKNDTSKTKIVKPKWHAVPLKGSFMVTAILGFLISAYWVYPQSFNFGVAFMFIFAAMFIASLISMTKAPLTNEVK